MENRRRILEMVREGVLTPEEALELLEALEDGEKPFREPVRLRVEATLARLEILGEAGLGASWAEGGALEGEVYRIGHATGVLHLPRGAWVDLRAKGSALILKEVALAGRALGSHLEGEGLRGLDLRLEASNLEATLLLKEGAHRLWVGMGNARLAFLSGSNVEVAAVPQLGHVSWDGPWRGRRLGGGEARLEAKVRLGHLELVAEEV